jgi:hypothetical protein
MICPALYKTVYPGSIPGVASKPHPAYLRPCLGPSFGSKAKSSTQRGAAAFKAGSALLYAGLHRAEQAIPR